MNVSVKSLNLVVFVSVFSISLPTFAAAQALQPTRPASNSIIGKWISTKVLGEPCASLTKSVQYDFDHDGYYTIVAETVNPLGSIGRSEAKGTYKLKGQTITGQVGEHTIGPFHYTVNDNELVMRQTGPACSFFFKRLR